MMPMKPVRRRGMLLQYGVKKVFNFPSMITQHVIIPIPNEVCIIANTPIAMEMFFGVLRVIVPLISPLAIPQGMQMNSMFLCNKKSSVSFVTVHITSVLKDKIEFQIPHTSEWNRSPDIDCFDDTPPVPFPDVATFCS